MPSALGPATVFLSEDDYEIDWASFAFVAVDDAYAGDYRDAFVVDLGAHKGYYGAYALRHGARGVVSYEPESTNASYLEAAAARLQGPQVWQAARAAVGAEAGEAALHVMGASWGHAMHPPDAWAEHEVGIEHVRVDALADVLSQAAESARGARTIVKVNIEGEECPTILGTPAAAWADVAEVYIETHPWATCGADRTGRASRRRRPSQRPEQPFGRAQALSDRDSSTRVTLCAIRAAGRCRHTSVIPSRVTRSYRDRSIARVSATKRCHAGRPGIGS